MGDVDSEIKELKAEVERLTEVATERWQTLQLRDEQVNEAEAENDLLKTNYLIVQEENARLNAEVERLKARQGNFPHLDDLRMSMFAVAEQNAAFKSQVAALTTENARLRADKERSDTLDGFLRKQSWVNHGCQLPALYGDDGEMYCNACMIDFRRWQWRDIEERLDKLSHERWVARRHSNQNTSASEEPPR